AYDSFDSIHVIILRRENRALRPAIHLNLRRKGLGQATCKHDDASLRCAVMHVGGPGLQSAQGRNVDDVTSPAARHQAGRSLRAEEGSLEVDGENAIPI